MHLLYEPPDGVRWCHDASIGEEEGWIRVAERRLAELDQELAAAKEQEIDEREIAAALSDFDPVWDALFATERSRILGLLVEQVCYDGRDGSLVVKLRPDGITPLSDVHSS